MLKKTAAAVGIATLAGAGALSVLPTAMAKTASDTGIQLAACSPCAAKKKGYNPCNPCAAKKKGYNPCNPCAAKKKGYNPC
ncbi:MAG: hypothetical protein QF450_05450, partial [Rhodospirillales bacterium]|nr:hypothetical protein [Rhodospirillales bacterium]